ncbi:MAG: transglutaminase family protein, partial [Spirochaetia bacterium]|nr:transglutaminase family protein [Spirochaetia bacterium]
MSIQVAIRHQTSYDYDRSVRLSPHVFRLRPAVHCRTPILSFSLKIEPANHFLTWQQDPFGNYLGRVVFPEETRRLAFSVEVLADIITINPFDFFVEESAETFPFFYASSLKKELLPYFETLGSGPLFSSWLKNLSIPTKIRTIDFLVLINQRIRESVNYTVRFEPGIQSTEETLHKKSGSCRDSAWLLVQAFRHFGLAARFVSGYLVQLKADQKSVDGPSGPENDFTDLHAWTEVYLPGAGWIGLDPTSGLFAGEGHIPLCATPDPASAAPVTGMADPAQVQFHYKNEVFRIHEDPRVTKPYSDETWATIIALGNKVDEDLANGDVRLTMGGEPTFVSVDDMEAKEWNTQADGPQKKILAAKLVRRLGKAFAPGALLHKTQGKWYPGEPLPRWQYSVIWRNDGHPLWKNHALLELEDEKTDSAFTQADAQKFSIELGKYLNIPQDHIHPAYEDAVFFLWEEEKVPANLNPYESDLTDPLERKKLADLLAKGLGKPAGYVIPLEWNFWNDRWISSKWEFRSKRLILLPGNSPIGMRLPLKSLPHLRSSKMQKPADRSPFAPLPPLEIFQPRVMERYDSEVPREELPKEFLQDAYKESELDDEKENKDKKEERKEESRLDKRTTSFETFVVKTALGIEARDGKLFLFLPPLQHIEHYLDLLASIEAAAEKCGVKVAIEGYGPPHDNRITKLSVTPDPGVLEVNVQPAKS